MIKYFHELTEGEFHNLCEEKPPKTWAETAIDYPQPIWCNYPDAVCGIMGCWSLMAFMVTGEDYCKDCDCYKGEIYVRSKRKETAPQDSC